MPLTYCPLLQTVENEDSSRDNRSQIIFTGSLKLTKVMWVISKEILKM